eukprot:GEMP01053710.1.p1 GENE.GEMP01053710.1~~GEMP01053710.1.p1  ORF type:complete len:339 (+),score=37.47 GEMP01053710.1:200-1216(+)
MFPLSVGHSMALFAVFFHGSASLYVKGAANRAAQVLTSSHPFLTADLHPLAFQVYFLFGVCLTSCFGLFTVPSIQFCPWACASGFLVVLYESLSLCAVYYIGLSVSLAIISSIAILSAFFMGHILFDNMLWSDTMTSAALTLMILGIVGVCWCNELGSYWRRAEERSPILHTLELESAWVRASTISRILGSLVAVFAGIAGSSMLLPWAFLDVSIGTFLPCFGCAALLSGILILGIWMLIYRSEVQWWCSDIQQERDALYCAVLSGIVWNAGNLFVMFAIKRIGYSLAYPIFHCQALVMVFWNLYLFKESREKTLNVYVGAGFLLITGGSLLSLVVHL